eukprot:CAMPEP_0185262856 /NCGR_PEP_ID=MMETSP1359-20130426/10896_1 /TAXON_ID=552665 /ORGANISM="Bigelowiella longifila, Strain CCMP242" /LENGTH=174 /DNA_ID=CAMNT_0027849919 /DNA_START=211 /DNA_END=735 /DNA_ORIENTATION=-
MIDVKFPQPINAPLYIDRSKRGRLQRVRSDVIMHGSQLKRYFNDASNPFKTNDTDHSLPFNNSIPPLVTPLVAVRAINLQTQPSEQLHVFLEFGPAAGFPQIQFAPVVFHPLMAFERFSDLYVPPQPVKLAENDLFEFWNPKRPSLQHTAIVHDHVLASSCLHRVTRVRFFQRA